MSLLTSGVHVALTELLHGLLSSDNTQRSVAEERLTSDWLAVQPDVLLMGLVEHIQESGEASVCCPYSNTYHAAKWTDFPFFRSLQTRSFAAVVFRRMATKSKKLPGSGESRELFLTLQLAQKIAIRQKLLQALETENIPQIRHKIGDAVAEVARQYADSGR